MSYNRNSLAIFLGQQLTLLLTGRQEFSIPIPRFSRFWTGGCGRRCDALRQPSSVPATAVSACSVVLISPFVPDFWAQTVAIAAKNRNTAMAERGVLAILSDVRASRPRFTSTTHATENTAAPTRQMPANRSLIASTGVVYQKIISPYLHLSLFLRLHVRQSIWQFEATVWRCGV